MRLQSEMIIWNPVALQIWPDVDTTVLICTDDGDLVLGYWDDADEKWIGIDGELINRALFWANVEGPQQ